MGRARVPEDALTYRKESDYPSPPYASALIDGLRKFRAETYEERMQVRSFRAHDKLCEVFQAQVFDGRMMGKGPVLPCRIVRFPGKGRRKVQAACSTCFACA